MCININKRLYISAIDLLNMCVYTHIHIYSNVLKY